MLRLHTRIVSGVLGLVLYALSLHVSAIGEAVPGGYWYAPGQPHQFTDAGTACGGYDFYSGPNGPGGLYDCPASNPYSAPNGCRCDDPDDPYGPHYWVVSAGCPVGQHWIQTGPDTGTCGTTQCDLPEVVNPITGQCTWHCDSGYDPFTGEPTCDEPPDVPQCDPDEKVESFTVAGNTTFHCVPELDEQCANPSGYFNGRLICDDDKLECENSGGTYGFVSGRQVCIPDDYDNDLPTCDSGGVVHLVEGGFVCETPRDPDPDNTPNSNEPDTDGDGIPNSEDSDADGDGTPNFLDDDVDGDGVPNASDNDVDGDGIPNADDPDIDGDQVLNGNDPDADGDGVDDDTDTDDDGDGIEDPNDPTPGGTENSVSGGGNCESQPQCQGDAIQCAILYQTWSSRCAEENEEFPDLAELGLDGLDKGDLHLPDEDITGVLSGVFNQTGAAGSCPAPQTLNLGVTSIDIPYTILCDYASAIRPMIILIFGFVGFRIIMRAF